MSEQLNPHAGMSDAAKALLAKANAKGTKAEAKGTPVVVAAPAPVDTAKVGSEGSGPIVRAQRPAPASATAKGAEGIQKVRFDAATGVPVKGSRAGSKRAAFIQRLEGDGITLPYALATYGWTVRDVRDVLAQLAAYQGIGTLCVGGVWYRQGCEPA